MPSLAECQVLLNAKSLSIKEMDLVGANLSKQDLGHLVMPDPSTMDSTDGCIRAICEFKRSTTAMTSHSGTAEHSNISSRITGQKTRGCRSSSAKIPHPVFIRPPNLHNGWNWMRYLFAALTAVFFISADFESAHKQSTWTEPTFVIAMAQTEATGVRADSQNANASASAEPSGSPNVEPARGARPNDAEIAAAPIGSVEDDVLPDPICEAIRVAAAEHDIPIGFLARLLWQESRFRAEEVSNAGARGIAQFMPQTAVEVGLKDPFDPLQAIPASARFLRKLHDQFGNLGLAAAAYNAGGGRIEKWLSRRASLPKETRDYVKIITGHKAEDWTDAENTVFMPTDLPEDAPCEGVGGLSKKDQVTEVAVDLAPSVNEMLQKAEADDADDNQNAALRRLRRVAGNARAAMRTAEFRKTRARAVLHAGRAQARKSGKHSAVHLAAAGRTSGRTKSARAAREL